MKTLVVILENPQGLRLLTHIGSRLRCVMGGDEINGIVSDEDFFEFNEEISILKENVTEKYFIDSLILKRDEEVTSLFHFKIKLASCFVA